jgi:hypothetical protein
LFSPSLLSASPAHHHLQDNDELLHVAFATLASITAPNGAAQSASPRWKMRFFEDLVVVF